MKLVIFDFNNTLYDPFTHALKHGATDILKKLDKKGYTLVLLSTAETRRQQVIDSLNINGYFSAIIFVKLKTQKHLEQILAAFDMPKVNAIIVGDNPDEELAIGKALGLKTIALAHGLCSKKQAAKLSAIYCLSLQEVYDEIT